MSEEPRGPTPEELMAEAAEPAEVDELPADLSGTVVRGVGLAGGGYVLAQALNLGFYLALARLATPSDFGEMAAGSLIVGVGLLVTESGMMSALIHRRDRVEEAANTAVASTFIGGLAFSLLALAAAPLIGLFFDSSTIGEVAAVLSGVIFLRTLTTVPDALLQRRFSFLRRVIIEPVGVIAFGIAAVIGTASGLGVWGLVIGQYAFTASDLVLSWALARWRPRLRLASYAMWRELVGYGRHILVATAILRVGEQADTLWLGRFLGTAPLGQYRYGLRLASTPYLALVAGASYVLFPAFARIAEERGRFEAAFLRSLRWMSFVAFPTGLGMLALGVPLAVTLFGHIWREAGEVAMAMCLYPAMSSLSSLASETLKADGRPELLTRMHTLTTVLAAALMGALLAPFGVIGVGAAMSIAASVSAVYAIHLVHRTSGFELGPMLAELWPSALAAVVMCGSVLALDRLVIHAADRGTAVALACIALETLIGVAIVAVITAVVAPSRLTELRAGIRSVRSRAKRSEPAAAGPEERVA
jgi:O-antigen/teichoic acid export membrane protein